MKPENVTTCNLIRLYGTTITDRFMEISVLKKMLGRKELYFHIGFWLFYFSSINANWSENWLDRSLREGTVSQFAIVLFPVLFYLNAFWLIPAYLKKRKWLRYIVILILILIFIEVFRCILHLLIMQPENGFINSFIYEFRSYDNIIFGRLNTAILCLQFSFAYRLSRDWIYNNLLIEKLKAEKRSMISEQYSNLEQNSFKTSFNIKKRSLVLVLKAEDIVYFKAQGDFVLAIDKNNSKHIINCALSKIKAEVDPKDFFQINRSEILNKNYIEAYESYIKNRLKIILRSFEDILYTSNSRTPLFRKWLQKN